MTTPRVRLTGQEVPAEADVSLDVAIQDFWQWGFSNLLDNDLRGVFAEWLVAQLLGIELNVRQSWLSWDLEWLPLAKEARAIKARAIKIEVKCGAYVQSWHTIESKSSRIIFTGLKSRLWLGGTKYKEERTYNADIYVFCVECCKSRAQYNALDLSQWLFYVLPRHIIECLGVRSMVLATVQGLTSSVTAAELRGEVARRADISAPEHIA